MAEIADGEGYYIVQVGEHIGYRYLVNAIVDKGAFGQVVRCTDMRDGGKDVALKISRNKKFDFDNSLVEVQILQTLKLKDSTDRYGIVRILDSFPFRKHMVLVCELLGPSLFKYTKMVTFTRFDKELVKKIASEIMLALAYIKKVGVIHCDLKPENILFTDDQCLSGVKLIDFGSSCFNYKTGFSYVQSRYYRSPEIVLGLPYT